MIKTLPTFLLVREERYTYDDYEELLEAFTTYTYDADGELAEKIYTEYDLDSRTFDETPIAALTKDRYTYAEDGLLIRRSVYGEDDVLQQYVVAAYDARGNKITETYFRPDGSKTTSYALAYDAQDRLVRRSWLNAEGKVLDYITPLPMTTLGTRSKSAGLVTTACSRPVPCTSTMWTARKSVLRGTIVRQSW